MSLQCIHCPRMNIDAQPSLMDHSTVYMGDFNARQPALRNCPNTVVAHKSCCSCVAHNHLTQWDTGDMHSLGGILDHILTDSQHLRSGAHLYLVFSRITLPSTFSNQSVLSIHLPINVPISVSHQITGLAIFPTCLISFSTLISSPEK